MRERVAEKVERSYHFFEAMIEGLGTLRNRLVKP
jgi:hypothetical protein